MAHFSANSIFRLPEEPYGPGETERCIEIPWALSCYSGEARVLDVGYAYASDDYLHRLVSLGISELYGLDMVDRNVPGLTAVKGDARATGFSDGFFDMIFCISTIEHIGRNNALLFKSDDPIDEIGDFRAMSEFRRITVPGGKIILTVPFGRHHDYGWFIQYDSERWNRLVRCSGYSVLREDFFIYKDAGWYSSSEAELKDTLYGDRDAPAASGIVCAVLET